MSRLTPLCFVLLLLGGCTGALVPGGAVPKGGVTATPTTAPLVLPGGRVLFSLGGIDLWSSAPDGSARRQITTDGSAGGYLGARWSPDGSRIAAERSVAGESGNALFLIDGQRSVRLTAPDTFLDGLSWSPSGRHLAYASLSSGGTLAAGGSLVGGVGDIHVFDTATGIDRIVGPGTHPAFSPDGLRIGYAHPSGAIAATLLDGSDTAFLATLQGLSRGSAAIAPKGMGLIGGPQWSADGKRIAYAAIERGPILEALQIVYVQDALPGAPVKQWPLGKTGAIHHVAELRWSPTAPVLAYSIVNAQPHHHWIGTIDPDDSMVHELYESSDHFLDYTWSPDGRVIIVQVDADDSWAYLVPGRSGVALRRSPGGWRPDWCACPSSP